jgi:hypothetical protein
MQSGARRLPAEAREVLVAKRAEANDEEFSALQSEHR